MRSTLNSLTRSFTDTVRYLNVVRNLPDYFDEEERRLVFQSIIIGVVVWAIVYLLREGVHWAFHNTLHWLEEAPSPFLVFVPLLLGALIVAALARTRASIIHYRDSDDHIHELIDVEGDGLERAISLYYSSEPTFERAITGQEGVDVRWEMPTFTLAIRKFLATLVTLGSGGSGGLEASVTLIGESVSAGLFKPRQMVQEADRRAGWIGRLWRWWQPSNPDDLQTAQLSGIAAAVAVLLGAPFAAAFFATEVMYRSRPIIEKLLYSLISALVAYSLTNVVSSGHSAIFEVETLFVPPSDWRYWGVLVLLGIVISLISIYFAQLRKIFEKSFHHLQPNIWRRHLTGAAVTGLVAVIVYYVIEYLVPRGHGLHGLELVLGPGETVVDAALAGELTIAVALIALFAKIVATLATVGSGGSAGLLVPSLFFSTMVGAAFGVVFNQYEPMMLIIPAMTASLASIVNVPLAAILFTVEVFGTPYMAPGLVMLVVAYVFAHDNTIYRTQRQRHLGRQIMPGVSSRRILAPPAWQGKTLIELDFRNRFDLNVIGWLDQQDEMGMARVHLDVSPTTVLQAGDVLVVLGRDEKLDALETYLRSAPAAEPMTPTDDEEE